MKFFAKCFGAAGPEESVQSQHVQQAANASNGQGSASTSTAAKTQSEGLKLKPADGWKKMDPPLSALPPDFSVKAKSLTRIDVSENQLQSLEFDFSVLAGTLKDLDVSSNKLKSLPASIGSLRNLEILHAYQNELESIPSEIGKLASLKELNVFNNKITEVPDSIGHLGSLELLNIASNQVCVSYNIAIETTRSFIKPSLSRSFDAMLRSFGACLHAPNAEFATSSWGRSPSLHSAA
jgi:hypothetical protein